MAVNKIPDSMLSKFTCSKCSRYVTMAPIAVEKDGQISCGNCTDWTVSKVRCNLLESLATLYTFPCKYKHAGCPVYLSFNDTYEHENNCEFHTFPCPNGILNSNCKWEGIGTSMLRHYKRQHPQFAADYPNFKITLEDQYEKYYLIEIDHILLLLQIKSSIAQGKLWFNTVYIGEPQNSSFIRYRLNLSCKDVSKQIVSLESRAAVGLDHMKMDVNSSSEITKKALLDVLEGATYIHCAWSIYIYTAQDDLKLDVDATNPTKEYLVEAKTRNTSCPNCNILMILPIYRCENSAHHITCVDCKGYYNECQLCQKNGMVFKRAEDLEKISELKFYNCRWVECDAIFTHQNIRTHELQCSHRIFKCPKCNIWSGDADSLFIHFKITHPKLRISKANPLFFNTVRFIPGYILTNNELFLLEVDVDFKKRLTNISVTYLGPPGQFNEWVFILTTKSLRDISQLGNEANVILFKPQPSNILSYRLTIQRADKTKTSIK